MWDQSAWDSGLAEIREVTWGLGSDLSGISEGLSGIREEIAKIREGNAQILEQIAVMIELLQGNNDRADRTITRLQEAHLIDAIKQDADDPDAWEDDPPPRPTLSKEKGES